MNANADIRFLIRRAVDGFGWETVSSGRASSWAQSAGETARILAAALSQSRAPVDVLQPARDLLDRDPAAEDGRAQAPRELGFIGKQLLPHLRRALSPSGDPITCNLIVYRTADFRYVRLVQAPANPPPLAYVGQWSHNPDYCTEVDLLALYCVLTVEEHRRGLAAWLEGEPACVLELPPFASMQLDIELSVVRDGESFIVTGNVADARLPNLSWDAGGGNRIVHHLPSLFSLLHKNDVQKAAGVKGQLLLASPHLRNAAARGAELWRDRTVRSALLIAPPGSGKEVLAGFLHSGRVLFRSDKTRVRFNSPDVDKDDWTLPTIQFAGYGSAATWRCHLFGELLPRDQVKDHKGPDTEVEVEDLTWRNGLIRRARGTTVFFDEIDKASNDVRRALLRFLENDDVAPDGGPAFAVGKGDGEEAEDFKCLRLFAGSAPRNEMFDLKPSDFWTRIQLVIDMVHPLEIHAREDRLRCLQEYVLMFLFRAVDPDEAVSESAPRQALARVFSFINDAKALSPDDLRAIAQLVANMEYPYLYLNATYARQLSQYVSEFLVWIPSARLSVRNLKALIKRLDVRIRDWVMYEFDRLDTEVPKASVSDPVVEQLRRLSNQPYISTTAKRNLQTAIVQLEARNHARHQSRDWIWAQLHHLALEVFDA